MSSPVKGSAELAVGVLGGACDGQATWLTCVPWPPYVEAEELVLVPHVDEEAANAGALKPPQAIAPAIMKVMNLVRILMGPPEN